MCHWGPRSRRLESSFMDLDWTLILEAAGHEESSQSFKADE